MRATRCAAAIAFVLAATQAATAQPVSTAVPPPAPAPDPGTYYQQPPPTYQVPPSSSRTASWFGVIGLGGMGYVGREITPYDDGNKGTGALLEAVAGRWMNDDYAIGARLQAHTDDAENYTDSSFTVLARFPVAANGRFYLEPALGLAFHKDEGRDTESGFAVAITGGYQLTRGRFACDLRFGGAHFRFDPDDYSHGHVWFGVAVGLQ
jgi:hypothetical protein